MEVYTLLRIPPPFSNLGFGAWKEVSSGRVLQGADSTHSADSTIEAGLPNIYGCAGAVDDQSYSGVSGGFYKGSNNNYDAASDANRGGGWYLLLDASRCSNIYGSSSTVQPPAYVVHIWKRVS